MRIAFDLRSLSSGTVSGVENYATHLLHAMLQADRTNQYLLFCNGFQKQPLPDFHYVNSHVKRARLPNKILNLSLKLNLVTLETLFGDFDWLFMPNLNQFSINPKTKLAITVHDLSPVVTPQFYDLKRNLWHKFLNYKKAFDRADVLFAVSEYTKHDLVKIFHINPEKIKVVYPGIDDRTFYPEIPEAQMREVRNLYNLPGKFILFLNTIEPRKNLSGLIKAFENLDSSCSLVIAGRLGWKYSRDFAQIRHSKKSAKINYIGYVEEKYKAPLIKMSRALVYPSFYEGFGFQALEAMALGTPVIASELTSLPEVVGDGGLLINPYDPKSLTQAMQNILEDKKLAENLIQKGLARAKQFTWQNSAQKVLESLTV